MAVPLLPLALIGSIAGGSLIAGTLLGSGTASEAFEDPPETGPVIIEDSDDGDGILSRFQNLVGLTNTGETDGFRGLLLYAGAFLLIIVFGNTIIEEVL